MPAGEETIVSEVLSASLGGAISAAILYPLEVLKTKMQACDDDTKKKDMVAFAQNLLEAEGIDVFFRGYETSAFQSALEKALYFFAYTVLKTVYQSITLSYPIDPIPNLFLGCAAEWAHLPITLPVDAWTTRIQTSTEAPLKILLSMLGDKSQVSSFYKGIQAYYLLCFKPALQYTVYEQIKRQVVKQRTNKTLAASEAFLLGMVARTVATVVVFPFLRAKVIMQTQKAKQGDDENGSPPKKQSMLSVLETLWERDGMAGLFQGLGPELTRGVFSAALMLMIKERVAGVVRGMLRGSDSKQLQQRPQYAPYKPR